MVKVHSEKQLKDILNSFDNIIIDKIILSKVFSYLIELPICNLVKYKIKGSLTLAMGKCLWFSVKIKVCQSSLSSP